MNTEQPPIEIDTLRQMLRTFLSERFQIKTHVENREINGYVLSAPRPKLTKADPSSRTRCSEGPAANSADPRNRNPVLSRLITCQNMTLDRQLGLKLELQKRPMPVLVFDHIAEKPIEN